MASVFRRYNDFLEGKAWSLLYWDGRPTEFLSAQEYEDYYLEALESNDVPTLNVMLDEIPLEFMDDIADRVMDMAYPEELEWYVTTTYSPLFLTFTPERFLYSPDLQDALATWPSNLYPLYRWWMTQPQGEEAIKVLRSLFTEGSLPDVTPQNPSLPMNDWRRQKKERFLRDRAAEGYQNPVASRPVARAPLSSSSSSSSAAGSSSRSNIPLSPPAIPRRQPRVLPPRQGSRSTMMSPASASSSASVASSASAASSGSRLAASYYEDNRWVY